MGAFDYPTTRHERCHGPKGYADYKSYRPWLRDEFDFRCVYCLIREQWGRVAGEFDVEHFRPQVKDPELGLDYDNLLYSCHTCNQLKGDRDVPDPCSVFTADAVRVNPDGSIDGLTDDAKRIIRVLALNSESYRRWRLIWLRNIELAEQYDPEQYRRLMAFPEDIPDLARLRPPHGNSRPDGIIKSHFAKRKQGILPTSY